MAKKTTKKNTRKNTRKAVVASHGHSNHLRDNCERCATNDFMLKMIFIVLGIAVIAAAYYIGFLVGSGGGPQTVDVDSGSANGKLVITEFSDFECPFCQRFYDDAYQQIKSTYGEDVTFDYKQFPLSFHPLAQKAAEASECAREQEKFLMYHNKLFDTKQLEVISLKKHAADLGLDTAKFNTCLDSGEKVGVVSADITEGRTAGVSGTPSFLINGELIVGAQPFSVFKQKIDAALKGNGPAPSAPAPRAPTPSAAPVDVSVDDDAVLGDPNAPVTIIEFSDYQCPFCGRHYTQTMPSIKKNFIDTGKVKYVIRDFPLGVHQNAQKAAEAAECAGEQGKYFEMHDKLFDGQTELSVANYKKWAGEIGLNTGSFDTCLDSGVMASEVQSDFSDGQAAGVSGTPGFFINGVKVFGAQPYSVFEQAINAALGE